MAETQVLVGDKSCSATETSKLHRTTKIPKALTEETTHFTTTSGSFVGLDT
jgi:hypothetical protein